MGYLKSRWTATCKGSPLAALLSLLGMKDKASFEEISLKEEFQLFTDRESQGIVRQMIDSYESGDYSSFYEEYQNRLPLASIWGAEEFQQRAQRGSLLDLLTVWNLISLGILYDLKWDQKGKTEELISFVDKRLSEFYNEKFRLDTSNERLTTKADLDLLSLLEKLDRDLISREYRLLYFGVSGEEYYVGVFDRETADRLVGKSFGIVTLYPCSD